MTFLLPSEFMMTGETHTASTQTRAPAQPSHLTMTAHDEPPRPILDEPTRMLVRRILSSRVLTIDEIKAVVASLMTESELLDSQRLMDGLRNAGLVTRWQASKLLAGKSRGFYLGAYKLLRPLGRGGMGMVYLGEHQVMKRQMALKVLPPDALGDERRVQRFKEEARASAQLDHLNIVRAYDFNAVGKKLYIVMEFVDGIDLNHAVARDGTMSLTAALDAMTQTCEGLVHAHERGIIHRDIKPSNLMLRSDGVIKITDMGLARIGWSEADDSKTSKRLLGTADFVAPEQAINSKTVDARADIYSLGCTWYFLLTGQTPYRGNNLSQRLAQHQTAPVPDVRRIRSDCPTVVAELIMRMMAKKPAARPSAAIELLSQLHRLRATQSEGGSPHEQLSAIVVRGEQRVDDSLYLATIEDGSSMSGSEVEVIEVVEETDEFDFASLPPLDADGGGAISEFSASAPLNPLAAQASSTRPIANRSQPDTAQAAPGQRSGSDGQLVMLGIGLAIAVIALLIVVGVAASMISQPLPQAAPKVKALEPGKDGKVILVK